MSIKFKRQDSTTLPPSPPPTLSYGEPAVSNDGTMYIGDGSNNVVGINALKLNGKTSSEFATAVQGQLADNSVQIVNQTLSDVQKGIARVNIGALAATENAVSATKLLTARTIALSGAATGTATSFNGTSNITIPVTSLDASKLTGVASVNTTGVATKAIQDETGNPLVSTYIKNITITAGALTFVKGDNKTSAVDITAKSLVNSIDIQANGVSLGTFNGALAKTINITADGVGAAPSSLVSVVEGLKSGSLAAGDASKLGGNLPEYYATAAAASAAQNKANSAYDLAAAAFPTSSMGGFVAFKNEAATANQAYYLGFNGGQNTVMAVPIAKMSVGYATSAGSASSASTAGSCSGNAATASRIPVQGVGNCRFIWDGTNLNITTG